MCRIDRTLPLNQMLDMMYIYLYSKLFVKSHVMMLFRKCKDPFFCMLRFNEDRLTLCGHLVLNHHKNFSETIF